MTISQIAAEPAHVLDPDAALMVRVRDGDASAFEELVRRYQDRLVSILEHLVGNADQAEDLAQDVFLRVFRARKTYSPDAKFCTWLFRIANNVASNARRSKSRRREVQVHLDGSGPQSANPLDQLVAAPSGAMPTRRLDKMERAQMVQQAMETLSERQRMALLLSKFEEMSYADIAQVMRVTVPAVKSLLSRARNNLRIILEPYMYDGQLPAEAAPAEEATNDEP